MTDWIGNKKTTFVTLGASSHALHERQNDDYYATDPSTIDALFEREHFTPHIWEPCCGEGHLSLAMEAKGYYVLSTDLVDRGFGEGGIDFLKCTEPKQRDIITNPPYKYAEECVRKALELTGNKVAMFLKIQFLEGRKRNLFFKRHPPKTVYVFSRRQKCALNGIFSIGSSAVCYAWYVWEKGWSGDTTLKWID